jgi:hypothetical protein
VRDVLSSEVARAAMVAKSGEGSGRRSSA